MNITSHLRSGKKEKLNMSDTAVHCEDCHFYVPPNKRGEGYMKSHLIRHWLVRHANRIQENLAKFNCEHCDCVTSTRQRLSRHLGVMHLLRGQAKLHEHVSVLFCDSCTASYVSWGGFLEHFRVRLF